MRNFTVYKEGTPIEYWCKFLLKQSLDIVIEGEFEATKVVTIGSEVSSENKVIMNKIQKEKVQTHTLKALSNNNSERSLESLRDKVTLHH